jgi:hypothetical protein
MIMAVLFQAIFTSVTVANIITLTEQACVVATLEAGTGIRKPPALNVGRVAK